MTIQEQVIKDRAFAITADAAFGIRPLSRPSAIQWLNLAKSWAAKHHAPELMREIESYIAGLEALFKEPAIESDRILAIEGNTIMAIGAA